MGPIKTQDVEGGPFDVEGLHRLFRSYGRVRPTSPHKTESGTRTRLDMIGRYANGDIACVECKASDTAPLTRNQKRAFPEIEQSRGRIMGKGKHGFPGATQIPPTRVFIDRVAETLKEVGIGFEFVLKAE